MTSAPSFFSVLLLLFDADQANNGMVSRNYVRPSCIFVQQEASFLIWYHTLFNAGERVPELLSLNLIGVCLLIMESKLSRIPDKTCAAGKCVCVGGFT